MPTMVDAKILSYILLKHGDLETAVRAWLLDETTFSQEEIDVLITYGAKYPKLFPHQKD